MKRSIWCLLLILALVLVPLAQVQPTAAATTVERVKELTLPAVAPEPRMIASNGSVAYFSAVTGQYGRELWRTDGTSSGTYLVKDIVQGPESGLSREKGNGLVKGSEGILIGNLLYFTTRGSGLWQSDGTDAGTRPVVSATDTLTSEYDAQELTDVNGTLFFFYKQSLWKSNGTPEGTAQVKGFQEEPLASVMLSQLRVVGNNVFFTATNFNSSDNPSELWRSDGTPNGTMRLATILAPWTIRLVPSTAVFNNQYFLLTSKGELWTTNGTATGTRRVFQFPETTSVSDFKLTATDNQLFISLNSDSGTSSLWRSDGTAAGTSLLANIAVTNSEYYDPTKASCLVSAGHLLFFSAPFAQGHSVWRSDGTPSGTFPIASISNGIFNCLKRYAIGIGGQLYFTPSGSDLWWSDGTPRGTRQIPSAIKIISSDFGVLNNKLLFFAVGSNPGQVLWQTDGTAEGTQALPYSIRDNYPLDSTVLESQLYFIDGAVESGLDLWRSNGSAATTVKVSDVQSSSGLPYLPPPGLSRITTINNRLLFFRYIKDSQGTRSELWVQENSTTSPVLIATLPSALPVLRYVQVNQRLIFMVADKYVGSDLWTTDGTPQGTRPLNQLECSYGVHPAYVKMTSNGQKAFVGGACRPMIPKVSEVSNFFLASTDDSLIRTMRLENVVATNLVAADSSAFFTKGNNELWKSDGTSDGTKIVTILPSQPLQTPVAIENTIFFTLLSANNGIELWRSDGTAAGTGLVADIWPGPESSNPTDLAAFNGEVFFAADDGVYGRELWRSNGTAAGTRMVKDINPGPASSSPYGLANVWGQLVFSADDGTHGNEIWKSGGTEVSTKLLNDVIAGSQGSDPMGFVATITHLYFQASTAPQGQDLWAQPAEPGIDTGLFTAVGAWARAGQTVRVPIRYINRGQTTATGVSLTVTLGDGLRLLSAEGLPAPTSNGSQLTWTLPNLTFLQQGQTTFVVQVPASAAPGATYSINLALTEQSTDADPSDNRSMVTITSAHLSFLPIVGR